MPRFSHAEDRIGGHDGVGRGEGRDVLEERTGVRVGSGHPAFLRPQADGLRLHLDETDRMHLDLWAADGDEQMAEVERLVSLGARKVEWEYPADADFVVLADPEGNLFCVIDAGR